MAGDPVPGFVNIDVVATDGPPCRVSVSGELDIADASALESLLSRRAEEAGAQGVELDLGGVGFIDSHGVRALARASRATQEAGSRLTVARVSPPVRRMMELAGMLEALGIPGGGEGAPPP